MGNHWSDDGDLVIEERTLFRQVGWLSHNTKTFSHMGTSLPSTNREGYSPVFEQIAVDKGAGWED